MRMDMQTPEAIAAHLGHTQPYTRVAGQWTTDRANAWYARMPWLAGTNYYPATAINQLEMWQEETWDPDRIDLEMQWSRDLGFNTHRVYLHDLAWEVDPEGFYARIDAFLEICTRYGVRPFFVFFDDCHNPFPKVGPQPGPVPAYHNSGWVTSPSRADAVALWEDADKGGAITARLKGYVQGTLQRFADDDRVLMWELYNEPGRGSRAPDQWMGGNLSDESFGDQSAKLVHASWVWARAVNSSQPICSNSHGCVGAINYSINVLNSDVHSIHCYETAERTRLLLDKFEAYGRPVLMTEYLARERGSTFEGVMPLLKERNVAAINWGFVAGKSGTIWPWSSRERDGGFVGADALRRGMDTFPEPRDLPEPELWFHDILRFDGTPYSGDEVACIKSLTKG